MSPAAKFARALSSMQPLQPHALRSDPDEDLIAAGVLYRKAEPIEQSVYRGDAAQYSGPKRPWLARTDRLVKLFHFQSGSSGWGIPCLPFLTGHASTIRLPHTHKPDRARPSSNELQPMGSLGGIGSERSARLACKCLRVSILVVQRLCS